MPRPHCDPRCPGGVGLQQFFRCDFHGWVEAWRCQATVRIHVAFVLVITGLGLYLRLGAVQWAVLVLTYGLVLVAELLNSALEALTDLVSPAYHPLAERAKDVAAGALLVAAVASVAVGLLILGPPLWRQLADLWPPVG